MESPESSRGAAKVGTQFAVYTGDPEDQEIVTVVRATATHVQLESAGEMNGWKPIELVEAAIAEANAP